jgi:linoleate 10R-lipoxygenase
MLLDSLVRGSDGRFADADLAKILQDATESPASAFKARGTPAYMRVVEVMGIEASRAWGTCTVSYHQAFPTLCCAFLISV